jgi:hypothetical protein
MAALGVLIFGSVRFLSKKVTKPNFFSKKPKPNQNWFKPTGFGSVRFGFLGKKLVQTGLARFFAGLARFFAGLAWVFSVFFGFGSVRFFRF